MSDKPASIQAAYQTAQGKPLKGAKPHKRNSSSTARKASQKTSASKGKKKYGSVGKENFDTFNPKRLPVGEAAFLLPASR
jgi:hypothetical protein